MSYLLAQIVVCLLIAGLIGAIIGWLLRGGCSQKLQDCEDKWKMKMGTLESECNSKLNRKSAEYGDTLTDKELQIETLKRHEEHVKSQSPSYSYEEELKKKLNLAQDEAKSDSKYTIPTATPVNDFDLNDLKQFLISKGINLSDEKIKLYLENGVDFEETNNLEDNYYIETIDGIDATYAASLRAMGIKTTQDLVMKLHNNNNKIDRIAQTLHIESSSLSSWVSMADLIQLPGVHAKLAKLMHKVGISTTRDLSSTNAVSLHDKMLSLNKKLPIVPEIPTIDSLSQWARIAK